MRYEVQFLPTLKTKTIKSEDHRLKLFQGKKKKSRQKEIYIVWDMTEGVSSFLKELIWTTFYFV